VARDSEPKGPGRGFGEWAGWFESLDIHLEENGDPLIAGPVVDQAALHGLLKKMRDLGRLLLPVHCLQPGETEPPGGSQPAQDQGGLH
jgi:hypothetical protein